MEREPKFRYNLIGINDVPNIEIKIFSDTN